MDKVARRAAGWLAGSAAVCLLGVGVYNHSAYAGRSCTGAADCKVCKNCKYCQHCARDGGSCGVSRAATQKSSSVAAEAIPPTDLRKLTLTAAPFTTRSPLSEMRLTVHNGADWLVSEITVLVTHNGDKKEYRFATYLEPRTVELLSSVLSDRVVIADDAWDCVLLGAKGYPRK